MEVRTIRPDKNTYPQVYFPCPYKKERIYLRKLFIVWSYRLKTLEALSFRLLQGKIFEKLGVEVAEKTLKQASIFEKVRECYRISHHEELVLCQGCTTLVVKNLEKKLWRSSLLAVDLQLYQNWTLSLVFLRIC